MFLVSVYNLIQLLFLRLSIFANKALQSCCILWANRRSKNHQNRNVLGIYIYICVERPVCAMFSTFFSSFLFFALFNILLYALLYVYGTLCCTLYSLYLLYNNAVSFNLLQVYVRVVFVCCILFFFFFLVLLFIY